MAANAFPGEQTRTTAVGLYTDANQFALAAKILLKQAPRLSQPLYYLLGHGIELALKAALLAAGESLTTLKQKVRHDLDEATKRVITLEHEPISGIVKRRSNLIASVNVYYQKKEFEYRVRGAKAYPSPEDLLEFLEELLPNVRTLAHRAYPHR